MALAWDGSKVMMVVLSLSKWTRVLVGTKSSGNYEDGVARATMEEEEGGRVDSFGERGRDMNKEEEMWEEGGDRRERIIIKLKKLKSDPK